MHTAKAFWSRKRLLKLFIFALLLANVTCYCVWTLARNQLAASAIRHNGKIYTAFLQAVERARATANPAAPQPGSAAKPVSPFWTALYEIRQQFPYAKTNILLAGSPDGDREHKVFDVLKTRARDWMYSDTRDGWARSFYVLPTRNTAAFMVMADVRDDLASWDTVSIIIGAYAFVLLFAFGWFWTRALDEAAPGGPSVADVRKRIAALNTVSDEIALVLSETGEALRALEKQADLRTIDDLAAQIRLLAVNGSIEAARSADTYRVFHVLMQEINRLATQARDQLSAANAPAGDLGALRARVQDLFERVSGEAEAASPRSSSSSPVSFRRVG